MIALLPVLTSSVQRFIESGNTICSAEDCNDSVMPKNTSIYGNGLWLHHM